MADRLRDLSEREQRIEIMRRNGEEFRDSDGNWLTELGSGPSSELVRAIWGDDSDDAELEQSAVAGSLSEGSAG